MYIESFLRDELKTIIHQDLLKFKFVLAKYYAFPILLHGA